MKTGARIILCSIIFMSMTEMCRGNENAKPYIDYITIASQEFAGSNCYPTIDLLEDGTLICVWTAIDSNNTIIGIVGAFSADNGKTWSKPVKLIKTKENDYDPSTIVIGKRVIVTSTTTPPTEKISTSITWATRSEDSGRTWSELYKIPMNHRYTAGKIHRAVLLKNGWLLMPYAWDRIIETKKDLETEGQMDCAAGMMISKDKGLTWFNSGDIYAKTKKGADGAIDGVDEAAIVEADDGSVYTLLRTGDDHLWQARSFDNGLTWEKPVPSPLKGRNAPAALFKLSGGQVAVIWNNAPVRTPLCAAISKDNCNTWSKPRVIVDTGSSNLQASYPGCVQAADGTILAVWQQQHEKGRDIRLARFNKEWGVN